MDRNTILKQIKSNLAKCNILKGEFSNQINRALKGDKFLQNDLIRGLLINPNNIEKTIENVADLVNLEHAYSKIRKHFNDEGLINYFEEIRAITYLMNHEHLDCPPKFIKEQNNKRNPDLQLMVGGKLKYCEVSSIYASVPIISVLDKLIVSKSVFNSNLRGLWVFYKIELLPKSFGSVTTDTIALTNVVNSLLEKNIDIGIRSNIELPINKNYSYKLEFEIQKKQIPYAVVMEPGYASFISRECFVDKNPWIKKQLENKIIDKLQQTQKDDYILISLMNFSNQRFLFGDIAENYLKEQENILSQKYDRTIKFF